MSLRLYVAVISVFAAMQVCAQDTIRIMTYNLKACQLASVEDIGKYIRRNNPDIVALQEIDVNSGRARRVHPEGPNTIDGIAYYADMLSAYGSSLKEEGGYYGVAILSKYPYLSTESVLLPMPVNTEQRSYLACQVNIKGHPICFVSTHLDLDKTNRIVQMKYINKHLSKCKTTCFIVGDLNSQPDDKEVGTYLKKWTDALPKGQPTFPALHPEMKLDYVLYRNGVKLKVIDSYIDTEVPLSDHCACIVDVVLYNK